MSETGRSRAKLNYLQLELEEFGPPLVRLPFSIARPNDVIVGTFKPQIASPQCIISFGRLQCSERTGGVGKFGGKKDSSDLSVFVVLESPSFFLPTPKTLN